ncbi:MAG TPA: GntR family transcriptional regulator [Solirubrobacteraceae bacterium]|nr:GntR family transcriptional regulator [Solirubrobacteraceae bacterium]
MQRPSRATHAQTIADELRRLIRSGELPAGTHLRQLEVARSFAVSITPVREAFTALAREGFVRQDAHRGVVVFVPSVADLRENYEIRIALEPLATELAATQITDAQLAELEALVAEMRVAIRKDLPRYASELNPTFHALIYRAALRPRLAEIIEQLRDASAAYLQLLVLKPQPARYLNSAHREHEEILAALGAHARERAAEAMRLHLEHNRDQILASLPG